VFIPKWTATKNAVRALEFTERLKIMVPTIRPSDDCNTRVAFTYHGCNLPHLTPSLDETVPFDSQSDPTIVGPSWRLMGAAVARRMQPHLSSSSEGMHLFMMPVMDTNLKLFQVFMKEFTGALYSTELITKDEKQSKLLVPTINRRVYQMLFGDIPLPLDEKLPQWATVDTLVCFMLGCSSDVHVEGFTVIVNGTIMGTLDTSLGHRCPHKNCLVCVGCAKTALATGSHLYPVCQGAVPLADRKFAVDMAAALTQSMFNLVGTKLPASGEKRHREHEDEMVQVELEENDIADDMLALGESLK